MLTYWNRIRNMKEDTLIRNAYEENIVMNSNWCQTIQILNCSQNLHQQHIPPARFKLNVKATLEKNFIHYWRKILLLDRGKLTIYSKNKQQFQIDQYLDLPFHDRKRISRFIASDHHLAIEVGRHIKIVRDQRICKLCNTNSIEDEKHFLMECPAYSVPRESILGNLMNPPNVD